MKKILLLLVLGVGLLGCVDDPQNKELLNQSSQAIQDMGKNMPAVVEKVQSTVQGIDIEEMKTKYKNLEIEVKALQKNLVEKKNQGLDKVEDIQTKLEAAQEAFNKAKAALDNLNKAGQELKESVSP